MKRRALSIAAGALFALVLPASAGAHAVLVASTPRWGATVGAAPRTLRLVFDENVVPPYARVAVVTTQGRNIAGPPSVAGSVVTVPLGSTPRGSYTVRWRMVASDDGHTTEGVYTFGVRTKPLAPAPVSSNDIPVAPQVLTWLQFVGVVLAGGMLTVRALVSDPARRLLDQREGRDAKVAMGIATAGAAIALHAGLFGFLIGAYPIVGGGLSGFAGTLIIPIRDSTHFGQAWMVTTFAWLGVLALLVAAWVTPNRREPLLTSAGLLSLATAFGISWASHPASHGALALVADYLHLVAGALWVGGLLAVFVLLFTARPTARDAVVRTSILRFSELAAPTVAVLALAGVSVALRQVPSASALLTSGYGLTLLVKSSVALGALALGGYHRRFVVPRIAAGAPVATIRRTLTLELGLLLAAAALAAVLSQTAPPT